MAADTCLSANPKATSTQLAERMGKPELGFASQLKYVAADEELFTTEERASAVKILKNDAVRV
jgi:hypothetical protein